MKKGTVTVTGITPYPGKVEPCGCVWEGTRKRNVFYLTCGHGWMKRMRAEGRVEVATNA